MLLQFCLLVMLIKINSLFHFKRRKGDSNPRYHFTWYTHFPGVRLRPLGHFSECLKRGIQNGRQNTKKIKRKRWRSLFFSFINNLKNLAMKNGSLDEPLLFIIWCVFYLPYYNGLVFLTGILNNKDYEFSNR